MTIPEPPIHISPETYATIDNWAIVIGIPLAVVALVVQYVLWRKRTRRR